MSARTLRSVSHPRHFALLGLALLATLLLSVVGALPASAHSTLLSQTPEDGAELDEVPEAVVLTFNEDITDLGSDIVITGPDGEDASGDDTTIDGAEVSRPVADDLSAGEYSVDWRVVSADGHPISGEFTFTLTEQAVGGGSATGTESPSPTGEQSETATSAPTEDAPSGTTSSADANGSDDGAADSGDSEDGTSAGEIALFVLIALVVIGTIVTLIVRMRRQQ